MVLFCADVLATERSGAATTAAIYTPNIHAKSMTIPEAAGASGNVVFIGGGDLCGTGEGSDLVHVCSVGVLDRFYA